MVLKSVVDSCILGEQHASWARIVGVQADPCWMLLLPKGGTDSRATFPEAAYERSLISSAPRLRVVDLRQWQEPGSCPVLHAGGC
jgi:hypothetical protein